MSKASQTTTKPVDVALRRDAYNMILSIERETATYLFAIDLRKPLDKALAAFRRKHPATLPQHVYQQSGAIRSNWEATAAGVKHSTAWDEFQTAATASIKASTRVLRHKPKSLTGAAYVALAVLERDSSAGPGYGYEHVCAVRIMLALFQAANLRLPPAVRRTVKRDQDTAAMLRSYGD